MGKLELLCVLWLLSSYKVMILCVPDSGVGAGIDSYYEYLLKAYVLLGDDLFLERFNIVSTHTQTLCWSNLMLHCVNNSICHNGISLMKQRYRFKVARLSRVLDHKGRCSCDARRTVCYPRRIVWTFLCMTDFCIYPFSSHWRDWKHTHTCQVAPNRVTVYS